MNLNFTRRKRERLIATEVEQQFLQEIKSSTEMAPPDLLAHHFAIVCLRLNFSPTDRSTGRILSYVAKSLSQKHRAICQFSDSLDRLDSWRRSGHADN